VNGLHITYAADTSVKDGERKMSGKDLQLGQLVEVEAERTPGAASLSAKKIEVTHTLEGPITKINAESGSIEVMGDQVRIDDLSKYPQLAVGLGVRISGLRDLQGNIVATNVSLKKARQLDYVAGDLSMDSRQRMMIGRRPVILPKGMKLPQSGEDLEAFGAWKKDTLHISRVSAKEEDEYGQGYLSIEGYIENVKDAHHAKICDEVFSIDRLQNTHFREGDRVIITGAIDKDGKIDALSIKEVRIPDIHVLGSGKSEPK